MSLPCWWQPPLESLFQKWRNSKLSMMESVKRFLLLASALMGKGHNGQWKHWPYEQDIKAQ